MIDPVSNVNVSTVLAFILISVWAPSPVWAAKNAYVAVKRVSASAIIDTTLIIFVFLFSIKNLLHL